MIATLAGTVAEKLGEVVVLDVQGVGYGLLVTMNDYGNLQLAKPAKLYVYEHIRDELHDLYGFLAVETKHLFEQLLSVNGVGPKMALAVLNLGQIGDVRQAIARGDVKFLQTASGVGRRVAERIVVDLKEKVGLPATAEATDFLQSPNIQDEAVQALVGLGYSVQDAGQALSGIAADLSTEERVKLALKARG